MVEHLFAYGTLQPGLAPPEIESAVNQLSPVGEGSVPGILYDLGAYPGAVVDPSSQSRVFGSVFRLPPDSDVLQRLDAYEDYNPSSPDASLFVRALHPVELAGGGVLNCWVYLYNRTVESAQIIDSGRY